MPTPQWEHLMLCEVPDVSPGSEDPSGHRRSSQACGGNQMPRDGVKRGSLPEAGDNLPRQPLAWPPMSVYLRLFVPRSRCGACWKCGGLPLESEFSIWAAWGAAWVCVCAASCLAASGRNARDHLLAQLLEVRSAGCFSWGPLAYLTSLHLCLLTRARGK